MLSYPQYCRYRSVLARLREQPSSLLIDHTVLALGGIAALGGNTRILYCRDTFEHPALLQNESICDEFGELGGSAGDTPGSPVNKLFHRCCSQLKVQDQNLPHFHQQGPPPYPIPTPTPPPLNRTLDSEAVERV